MRTPRDLDPFLSARWRKHLAEYGKFNCGIYADRGTYPRFSPNTCRRDAWPPGGGLPGSDVDFIRSQLLDANDIEFGVLEPLLDGNTPRNLELQAALCSAINDWQVTHFVDLEPRLRASILVPQDDPEAAVKEIEKRAAIGALPRSSWARIRPNRLAAGATGRSSPPPKRTNLPIGLHVGGTQLRTLGLRLAAVLRRGPSVLVPLDAEPGREPDPGRRVRRFPNLKICLIEGGFAWVPSLRLAARCQRAKMRDEVPHLKRPPSEYLRPQSLVRDTAGRRAGEPATPAHQSSIGSAGTVSSIRATIRTGTTMTRGSPSRSA